MKNRILAFAMILCMLLSLCGCGGKEQGEKLVLALRAGVYSDVIKKCLPDFEQKYGVTCEIYELSENDLHSYVLNDSVLRHGSYDICMVDSSWVMEYVEEGVLADIGKLGCVIDDDIISATSSICVQNGITYLMPYYGNVTVLMYNKTLAAEYGFADGFSSLSDLTAFCKEAKAHGKNGFIYRGDTENNIVVDFLPILRAFGGWVVDENNNPTVLTTEFAAALRFYMELIKTGESASKDKLIDGLEKGRYAAAVGWPGWYDAGSHNEIDYVSLSGRADLQSPVYNSNIYGIWTLGIPQNSKNKELAGKLLSYLMDPEVQKGTVAAGGVPCRYSVLSDPEIVANNPKFKVICEALENGIYRPAIREWPGFYTVLGNMMRRILDRKVEMGDGLVMVQSELEELMKSN